MQISPLELFLDSKNYRLYTLTSSPQDITAQAKIRELMAKNPKVDLQGMVDDILRTSWRSIGERPVVCHENGRWVVLEGNRRTCACQMILDQQRVTGQIRIPNPVPQNVLDSLQLIEVDTVANREAADPIISGKHINATIRWTTISQMRFCVDKYDAGTPIPEIERDGAITRQKLYRALREYRLLYRAANKPGAWSIQEKEKLESLDLKPDRFLRLFRTGGAMLHLGLRYDNRYRLSSSIYGDDTLTNILVFIARKTLIEDVVGTRYNWLDLFYPRIENHQELLPHVQQLWRLMGYVPPAHDQVPPTSETGAGEGGIPAPNRPNNPLHNPPGNGVPASTPPASPGTPPLSPNAHGQPPRGTPPPIFMENLNCTLTGADAQGVLVICDEIRRMSQGRTYMQYPIAAAVLIRALLEQTFKYHLKKTAHYSGNGMLWDVLVPNPQPNNDPTLGKIINFIFRTVIGSGHLNNIFPSTTDMHAPKDIFDLLFQDGGAFKRYTDMVIHHPHIVAGTPQVLNELSRGALVSFLNYIYSLH